MRHKLIATMALLAASLTAAAQLNLDNLTKEDARQMIEMIAEQISGETVKTQTKELTGLDLNLTTRFANDTLTIVVAGDGEDSLCPPSVEFARFEYACDRGDRAVKNAEVLAAVLGKAECHLRYVYFDDDSTTVTLSLSPEEISALKTAPLNMLKFDRSKLLNEVVELFEKALKEDDDEDILSAEAAIDGQYIALRYVFASPQEYLAEDTPGLDAKKIVGLAIAKEMGGHTLLLEKLCATCRHLSLKGLKYDCRDLSGRQKVIILSWDDIDKAIASSNGDAQGELTEHLLNLLDSSINAAFAEEGADWESSHLVAGGTIYIALNCQIDPTQFAGLQESFGDRNLVLDLYAEALQGVLELDESIERVVVMIIANSDTEVASYSFTRDEIMKYVAPEDDEESLIGPDGLPRV